MPETIKTKSAVKARQKLAGSNSPDSQRASSVLQTKQKLPVYVSPDKVTFYLDDRSTHSRILTIYNPYDFSVYYKVLCTAPKNYTVAEAKGNIKPHSCSDIVVRRISLDESLVEIVDKFRVEVFYTDIGTSSRKLVPTSLLGAKDIPAVLLSSDSAAKQVSEELQNSKLTLEPFHPDTEEKQGIVQYIYNHCVISGEFLSTRWLLLTVAIACLIALGSHTAGQVDDSSFIPSYISFTPNQKLVAAYILGLVTMAIFNPL
uniref:SUN domain-containing protein 2-like n=1 Tax=Ciona intestinalis TaxID=7719 RepID=H2XZL7_CIOIN